MKIALVHDVLNQIGGAEKVLENFLEIWPDAVIHTVFYDEQKTFGIFSKFRKKISNLDRFPFAHKHPKLFLPIIPLAFEDFDFKDFDVVLSDSSAFAKFAKSKDKPHISYIHTPTRFLWTEPEYIDKQNYPFFMKWAGKLFLPLIRNWDYKAAQRVNYIIANSKNVQDRIKKYYQRDSVIIPPPVDTEFYKPTGNKSDFFLAAGRMEAYKRTDLIIQAFNQTGYKLKIAGTGSDFDRLKKMANSNIEFMGRVSDEQLRDLYSQAKAFVFAAEEDAGIMVVEAQACSTPVIAYGKGGALETVISGQTGEFFSEQTVESLVAVLKNFQPEKYDSNKIRENAKQFDKKIFQAKIKEFVEDVILNPRNVRRSEGEGSLRSE